jgi:hypothetical protein
MAWETVLTTMVRNLISDMDEDNQTYTDGRIQECIVVAGLIVAQEYNFSINYTFDIDEVIISPDPTLTATLDTTAMGLFSLKAACILNMSSYQGAVGTGIRVRDGTSEIDTTSGFKGWDSIIANGPCATYKALLKTRMFKDSMNRGKAVMGPLSHPDFLTSSCYSTEYFYNNIFMR